jgi:Fe-S cluster assembly protein SufD
MPTRTVVRRRSDGRKEAAADFAFSEGDSVSAGRAVKEPASLLQRRAEAWSAYRSLPIPSLTDEPWRRTDLRRLPVADVKPGPADDIAVDPEYLRPLAADKHSALLVLRPGRPTEVTLDPELATQGVVFSDWATAVENHPELVTAHAGRLVRPEEGKFAALASAMASDGVVVHVPPQTQVSVPLHSVLWAPGRQSAFFSRILVVVGEGASVTYVHETASPTEAEGQAVHAGLVELAVGPGAKLTFVELQSWGEHVWNFTHERARVEQDGRLDWIFGAVGSLLTKNFSELDLRGRGAVGRMSGFYFADGVQHLDHDTQQNHWAPDTTSDLLFKGALVGKSRSVWQGMIYVAPGAQKTDGYQANRNLILSRTARADSIPRLEILADDVRCTHGATVGQLEEEPIFYLMSRGLPRAEAERIVVDGFFDPVMQRIPFEGVRERFQRMIDEKMG